jgi:rhodanese-related sulfurtransferase
VRTIGLAITLVLATVLPGGLGAQNVETRVDGRVSPELRRAVKSIAADAAARGLPVDPLVQKAIEGAAKGVPADRVIAAVRALAGRLAQAKEALREAGFAAPSGDVLEGGADALNAGLSGREVRDLVVASRAPYDPALTLRVAATLAALGVPAKQTLELLQGMISSGRSPTDLLGLPGQVQSGVARGATPAQAAAGLARAAGGPPPGRSPDWVPPGQRKPKNPHKP